MSIKSRCSKHTVDHYRKDKSTSGSVYQQTSRTLIESGRVCTVAPRNSTQSEDRMEFGSTNFYDVFFYYDPEIAIEDEFEWEGTVLEVEGSVDAHGQGRLWRVPCVSYSNKRPSDSPV